MTTALEAHGLSRRFGSRRALTDVDLAIPTGETLALFGANGAGKSTLLRLFAARLRPHGGRVSVAGLDILERPADARRRIGLVGHAAGLYRELTVRTNLRFFARLAGVAQPAERADEWIERFGLATRADDAVGTLSRGLQQRTSLCRALLHDPEILLLDEPFEGLDPRAAALLRTVLVDARDAGKTLVVATHDLRLGAALASRWVVLDRGRVADHGIGVPDPEALATRHFDVAGGAA